MTDLARRPGRSTRRCARSLPVWPAVLLILAATATGCSAGPNPTGAPPAYDHVVIVVEENHSAYQLVGAAYFNSLAARGARFTHMYAITHPSQPNYVALFSGSTQGVTNDAVYSLSAPNLYDLLAASGHSFAGYSEDLPTAGFTGASSGLYVRKHAPWVSFASVPASVNLPFTAFPSDYSQLPTVSFVIPNLDNDMHDGTIAQADAWLAANLNAYGYWAVSHNSLLIVTFDEPYDSEPAATTPIATCLVGAGVIPGAVVQSDCTLYSILRLVEEIYRLPSLGSEAVAPQIRGPWG